MSKLIDDDEVGEWVMSNFLPFEAGASDPGQRLGAVFAADRRADAERRHSVAMTVLQRHRDAAHAGKVKARLVHNYRGGFVVTSSSSGKQGVPVLAKSFGTQDFSIGYDLSRQLSVVFDGVNIGGVRSEQYYGNTHNPMNCQPLNKRYGVQARYVF